MTERRIACQAKGCGRTRKPRPEGEVWSRWFCPKCWPLIRADTASAIGRNRDRLGKALRAQAHDASRGLTILMHRLCDDAVSQVSFARAAIARNKGDLP